MRLAVLLSASALLAGCSAISEVSDLLEDKLSVEGTEKAGLKSVDKPSKGKATDRDAATRVPKPAPLPKRKPRRFVGIDPKILVGMTRVEVAELIGRPLTVADRPPATVWTYRTTGCALEIFFYLDVGSKKFRALTYDLKGAKPAFTPPSCLGRIRAVSYGS